MPLSGRMDKVSMAHLHIRVLLSDKINDIFNFACKWIEKQNTKLNEIIQTQKYMVCTHSLVDLSHKQRKLNLSLMIL